MKIHGPAKWDGIMQNLLVIVSDEHQARALGCAGHEFVKTPHLDALANRGTRFTNAYTPSPICVPARAAFATGQYVHQTGHWDNATPYHGTPKGWGHQLQQANIPVNSIGKLHYRDAKDDNGFDDLHIPMMVQDGVGMIWASIRHEEERLDAPGRMLGKTIGRGTSTYTEYDSAVTELTADWLHAAADRPHGWCLYVGLVAPHFPLVAPGQFYDMYADIDFPTAKQHPDDGYPRHPWIEKQNAFMDSEGRFADAEERRRAFIAYYGLVSWLDHNVGQILSALDGAGLTDNTTVIYSSDHGDNVGARGLWGKSNMYEESAAIPMIMARPGQDAAVCDTPVSLMDLAATIPTHFELPLDDVYVGKPLYSIAEEGADKSRAVFSEYHAAGAVSGAFMIRKGDFKLIHYVGFEDELFDLASDPEELTNLAANPTFKAVYDDLLAELRAICDPVAVILLAHADQRALVEGYGGLDAVRNMGPKGATPPPSVATGC